MAMELDLLAATGSLYNRLMLPVCEAYGLTPAEVTVLLFLANNPEHDTATEIVAHRRLSKSYVSASVRTLREKGLLEGTFRGRDRRSVHLRLCEAAAPAVAAGQAAQQKYFSILLDGMSAEDRGLFERYIGTVKENAEGYLRRHKQTDF